MITEKEKMLAGELYDANYDKELLQERKNCKIICSMYNNHDYADIAGRDAIMRKIIGEIAGDFCVEPSFWCDYGYNISIGKNFFSNHNLVILDGAKVTFGNNVFIAPNCGFYTAGHPTDVAMRNAGIEFAKPISIGDNVWIGAGVTVLPGVVIGDNVTIGAGSLVVKDIPANSIAVGNPCMVIKNIG